MSEISEAQLLANQENGKLSHGPVTDAGKRRSSLNAIRHGLCGRTVVLPTEDIDRYKIFCQQLLTELAPKTPHEQELAQIVIDQYWRLNRVRSIEEGLLGVMQAGTPANSEFDNDLDSALGQAQDFCRSSREITNLTIYEQRIHRLQEKALKQLKQLQAERQAKEKEQLEEAIRLQQLHEMHGLKWNPQENGFVYSSEDLKREFARRILLKAADLAQLAGYNLAKFRALDGTFPEKPGRVTASGPKNPEPATTRKREARPKAAKRPPIPDPRPPIPRPAQRRAPAAHTPNCLR